MDIKEAINYYFMITLNRKAPFQLIPKNSRGIKMNKISAAEWEKITNFWRKSHNYVCEYCGEKSDITHTHEVWNWDITTKSQVLKDLKCVCNKCHNIVHPGFAQTQGMSKEEILKRYSKINNITMEEAEKDWESSWNIYHLNSQINFAFDTNENVSRINYILSDFKNSNNIKDSIDNTFIV